MEIADNSDIEWASFNGHWILLEEWELVKGRRKIGAMYMSERLAEKEMVEEKVHTVELEAIKIQG
jgi:DNA-binding transcriptional ArsR family regulator